MALYNHLRLKRYNRFSKEKEMKPISPSEVKNQRNDPSRFPEEVIRAFNELILKEWSNSGYVTIKQDDVITRILELMPGVNRHQIFENKWLDIELAFKAVGWHVEYDKPAYNESYPATFKFRQDD